MFVMSWSQKVFVRQIDAFFAVTSATTNPNQYVSRVTAAVEDVKENEFAFGVVHTSNCNRNIDLNSSKVVRCKRFPAPEFEVRCHLRLEFLVL